MPHSDLILQIAKAINCKSYLELGLYDGNTIKKVKNVVLKAVGVDIINPNISANNMTIFTCTTDSFFEQNQKKELFDLIFIDADHKFEQVRKDFKNAIEILNDGGIIILHDTDPISEKYLGTGYCNDSYKMVDYVHERGDFDIVTLPVSEAGLSILKRKKDRRINGFLKNQ